jgi:hypothetical protein
MALEESDLVIRALRDPQCMQGWTPRQFELMYRQAVQARVLHRIGTVIEAAGLGLRIPAGLASQLEGTRYLLSSHRDEVVREIEFIRQALLPLNVRVVLLKGAAYMMAGLPAAQGRLFSDVDILVPRARLDEVEGALMLHGWAGTHETAYDQRYYREWMHELPPMVHMRRSTSLDVHHALAPLTGRWRVASDPLLADAVPLPGHPGMFVLAPVDMVLHSMVHLLLNDDLSHGLRDTSDLDLLLRHFGRDPSFWTALVARAEQLSLKRALFHGLWCVAAVLGTPVPSTTLAAVADWGPGKLVARVLHACWRRALRSPHRTATDAMTPAAMFVLYVRAHWLRMPPVMLARHLTVKALRLHEKSAA